MVLIATSEYEKNTNTQQTKNLWFILSFLVIMSRYIVFMIPPIPVHKFQ